ncbi:MAG: ribonuclease III [Flavobacteriales bacterium]|nr:ribonuclease III [Flavobacteriales bacterium]
MLNPLRSFFGRDKELTKALRNLLGFTPKNVSLYRLALIHRSAGERLPDGTLISNERLEFLGDAVLSTVVAKYLFQRYPFENEGFLTETRSKIVSRKNLNALARKLGLPEMVNKSSENGPAGSSLGGDALEALVGAIFLDRGYSVVEKFILDRMIDNFIDLDKLLKEDANFKSRLIEWCQKERLSFEFEVLNAMKDGHRPSFTIQVKVDGKSQGKGTDRTKKKAEQAAAKEACEKLDIPI